MPAVIAHYLCGKNAAIRSTLPIRDIIVKHKPEFSLGTQGPDIFFFAVGAGKKTKSVGGIMHNGKIGEFFQSAFDYSKISKHREVLFCYLLGFLSHYALDTNTHPFVFYHTGFSDKTAKLDKKYTAAHMIFETEVDSLTCRRFEGISCHEIKIYQRLLPDNASLGAIAGMLKFCIKEVYEVDLSTKNIVAALKSISTAYKLLRSRFGFKKRIINGIETRLSGYPYIAATMHYEKTKLSWDDLIRKKSRYLPWSNEEQVPASFYDLFLKGIDESRLFFEAAYLYIYENTGDLSVIGNRNFSSGLEESVDFVYFDDKC